MINFDKASIAPIKPEVVEAMNEIYTGEYGNPSSLHQLGFNAKKKLEESREIIAGTINAEPGQIIFTSGSTEAINWFVKNNNRRDIKITGLEHHAFLNNIIRYKGYKVFYYETDKKTYRIIPRIVSDDAENPYAKYINVDTQFVEHVNSEIGVINSISECPIVFVDAAQSYGHIPIDVKKGFICHMSTSAQKFGGPSGVGFLYSYDTGGIISPIQKGGQQEFGLRAGTENLAGIVGMAKAAQIAHENMKEKRRKVSEIRNKLYGEITNNIPCAHLNGSADWRYRYEGNLNFRFDGYRGEEIQSFMNDFDVLVSTGSACASGSGEPSHVLKAIGLTDEEANSSIRFSFDSDNHISEVKTVVDVLIAALEALKK